MSNSKQLHMVNNSGGPVYPSCVKSWSASVTLCWCAHRRSHLPKSSQVKAAVRGHVGSEAPRAKVLRGAKGAFAGPGTSPAARSQRSRAAGSAGVCRVPASLPLAATRDHPSTIALGPSTAPGCHEFWLQGAGAPAQERSARATTGRTTAPGPPPSESDASQWQGARWQHSNRRG